MSQVVKSIRALRRILAQKFDKDYIKNKLKKRTGRCKKCGKCCQDCVYLDKKTNLCKTYENRPKLICYCDFPLDKEDQRLWKVDKVCGYKFKD